LSGISIPFLLPGALPWHRYYLWGVLAPLALSGGFIAQSIMGMIAGSISDEQLNIIRRITIAVLIFGISINGGILEGGYLYETDSPVVGDVSGVANYHIDDVSAAQSASAGMEIRDGGYNGGKIVFVGDWDFDRIENTTSWSNLIRISVYSGISFKQSNILDSGVFEIDPKKPVPDCEYRIIKNESDVYVNHCEEI
jgi:hypothetical protein